MHWETNTCRICGQIGEICHPIFNNDQNPNILDKIKKCLPLQLSGDDFKPKKVCNDCLNKINDFHELILSCYEADQRFDQILNRSGWNQGEVQSNFTQQKLSVIVTAKSSNDGEHLQNFDLYKDNVLPLENCSIGDDEMLEIVDSNHSFREVHENLEYLNADYGVRKLQCIFLNESTVLRYPSNPSQTVQQTPCYTDTVINYSSQEHTSNCSKETETLMADQMPYTASCLDYSNYNPKDDTAFQIPAVKKAKKLTRSYACPHCDKKFKRRPNLNTHIAVHTNIRPYLCASCNKTYATKCDLTNHQKIHTDQHRCEFCSRTFVAPSKLERHLRTHTKEKPFRCDWEKCNKSFSDKRNLDSHKILHRNVFDFPCKECNKLFKSKNQLKQHAKVHSSISTFYVCELCSKKYKYKSTLIFHMKKHNGYVCCYCDKDCEKAGKLVRHKRVCSLRTS